MLMNEKFTTNLTNLTNRIDVPAARCAKLAMRVEADWWPRFLDALSSDS
jgi:hypothetical protein